MDIKRYIAPDMRRAIHQARVECGPDAVILSSEAVEGGVEIIAARDFDAGLFSRLHPEQQRPAEDHQHDGDDVGPGVDGGPIDDRVEIASAELVEAADAETVSRELDETRRELRAISENLSSLKGLVRERIAWADTRAARPERNWLMRRAESFGLDVELADRLVSEVEHLEHDDRAWREVIFGLARRLTVMRDDPIEHDGVIALLGPTGVGKTTTIAKLAAKASMRFGPESVALITIDNDRIGAHRQLEAYGAILGVPVYKADSLDELASLLGDLHRRRVILIDTAGAAYRDAVVDELETHPGIGRKIRKYLVLAANMQASFMLDAVHAFGGQRLSGIALTKIDEAPGAGAAVSVLIKAGLPAVWLTAGHRIPDDIKLARVSDLLKAAADPGTHEAPAAASRPSADVRQGCTDAA